MNPVQELVLITAKLELVAKDPVLNMVETIAMDKITEPELRLQTVQAFVVAAEYLYECMASVDSRHTSTVRGLLDLIEKENATHVITLMRACVAEEDRTGKPDRRNKTRRTVKWPIKPRGQR